MVKQHHVVVRASLMLGITTTLAAASLWFGENRVLGSSVSRPLYEPADGVSYFGFTFRSWDSTNPAYGDTRVFADRFQDSITVELGGKQLSLYTLPTLWQKTNGTMVNFSGDGESAFSKIGLYDAFNNGNSVPVISWQAQTGWGMTDPGYTGINTHTINSGSLDGYIHQYARDVKAYGKPLFVNPICKEVNGSWNRNCSPNADPTLTKAAFISAQRRIVDIFRQEGVTNVAWVWTVNSFPAPPAQWGIDTDFASYYPGDDYVDWIGIDHYDYGSLTNASTDPMNVAQYLDPEYNFAVTHAKPVMIPEFGVRHSGSSLTAAQQQMWLGLMFDYLDSHPKIKAVLYFNYNMNTPATEDAAHMADHVWLYNNQVNYHPDVNNNDHRLLAESGASFRGTFADRIGNDRYVSQLQFNTTPLPDTVAPNITITSPAANATVTRSVNIAATGYDAYGITKVELYVDNSLLRIVTNSPYSSPWDTTGYANNTMHTLSAKAYDAASNIGSAVPVIVKVSDTVPPTVAITSPANNSQVSRAKATVITALASDVSGITKVEFYVNSSLKCTGTTAPYSCSWSVPGQKGATYALTARASDTANNKAASSVVTVTSK
jgi:hypothetical protein